VYVGTEAQFLVLGAILYAGSAILKGLDDFVLIVADAGDDPQARDDDPSHDGTLSRL
jgi:hypothetical protein